MRSRGVTTQLGEFLCAAAIGINDPKLLLLVTLFSSVGKERKRLGIRRPNRIGIDSFSRSFELHHCRARISRRRANVSLLRCRRGSGLHPRDIFSVRRNRDIAVKHRFPKVINDRHCLSCYKCWKQTRENKMFHVFCFRLYGTILSHSSADERATKATTGSVLLALKTS